MTNSILMVLSNPADGADDAYNRWYDDEHLDEVLEIPGFVAAQRFKLSGAQAEGFPASEHRYLTVYEIEGDPADALARLMEEVGSGRMVLPAVLDADSIRPWCFEPTTERVTASPA